MGCNCVHISIPGRGVWSARSLCPKIDELRIHCELNKPDIVCISETWLGDGFTISECSIPGYHCERCDRHKQSGELLCSISDRLETLVLLCDPNNLELLLVSVNNVTTQDKMFTLDDGIGPLITLYL